MRIWDLHCHISGNTGSTPEERLEKLIAIADRMGIERLCVYMGMKLSPDPTPETFRRENDEVLQAIAKFPDRTFGFVYLNPRHVDASLSEFERCVANGPIHKIVHGVALRGKDAFGEIGLQLNGEAFMKATLVIISVVLLFVAPVFAIEVGETVVVVQPTELTAKGLPCRQARALWCKPYPTTRSTCRAASSAASSGWRSCRGPTRWRSFRP